MSKIDEALTFKSIVGNFRADITKYRSTIETKLFPILKDRYTITLSSENPVERINFLAYYGKDSKGNKIVVDFNSNHKELNDYDKKDNVVFSNVYYNTYGNQAGILNLDDLNETADLIYSALYEIGFRTQRDINREIEDKEDKDRAAEEERQAEINKSKQETKDTLDKIMKSKKEEEPKEDPILEYTSSLSEYISNFIERNEVNSELSCFFKDVNYKTESVEIASKFIDKNTVSVYSLYFDINGKYKIETLKNFIINKVIVKYPPTVISIYDSNGKIVDSKVLGI